MKEVDFHGLSRTVQERWVGSAAGRSKPTPILAQRGASRGPYAWLVVCVAALVVTALLLRVGFADLQSKMGLHPVATAGAYGLLIALALFSFMRAMAHRSYVGSLPFPPGVYLFPMSLVDARRHVMQVFPVAELTTVDGQYPTIRLQFPEKSFSFAVADRARSEQVAAEIQKAREQVVDPKALADPQSLFLLDPLYEPRYSSPLGPRESIIMRTPSWAKLAWLYAAVLGLVFGPTLWFARNVRSDERMFARASDANDAASYRAYLAHGKRYRDRVAKVLLPRAELAEAKKDGSVEAIQGYIKDHLSTGIQDEVDAALRTAMLAELEKAKQPGTLAALVAFTTAHPDHALEAELKVARHGVYVAAVERFKQQADGHDKTVLPFVERLVSFAEAKGPGVEIRFRRAPSKSMTRADKAIEKNHMWNGDVSRPSRYFDSPHALAQETVTGKALIDRFGAAFPAEILTFSVGAPIDVPEAGPDALPTVTVPTLFVTHGAEWSGTAWESKTPRGIYVGLTAVFDAAFVIPNDARAHHFKLGLNRPIPIQLLKDPKPPATGTVEDKIYETMWSEAFEQFGQKYLGTFFKPTK